MRIEATIWPASPTSFDRNGIALILLDIAACRAAARKEAREVLKNSAARLLGKAGIELIETPHGPRLDESGIHVSLSYVADKALIGLSHAGPVGVDIVRIEPLPGIDALAKIYLPSCSVSSDADFALAWARMEACCKALNLPLAEIDDERKNAYAGCDLPECMQIDGYRMAVALAA